MEITTKFAELIGIILGDGNIYINKKKSTYRITIVGHSSNDFEYLVYHVKNLVRELSGKSPSLWKYKNKKAIAISLCSKKFVFEVLKVGLKGGKKVEISIPPFILNSKKEIKAAFLRGLADTDFWVTFKKNRYPVIGGSTSSKKFAKQIVELLKEFNIKASIDLRLRKNSFSKKPQFEIKIYGVPNFKKWIAQIGFNNPKHLKKVNKIIKMIEKPRRCPRPKRSAKVV